MYKDPFNLLYSPFLPFSSGSLILQFPFANPSGLYTRHSGGGGGGDRSTLSSPHHTRARAYYALWFELVRESKERVLS